MPGFIPCLPGVTISPGGVRFGGLTNLIPKLQVPVAPTVVLIFCMEEDAAMPGLPEVVHVI